jgi:4-alpha-glucanotransferase
VSGTPQLWKRIVSEQPPAPTPTPGDPTVALTPELIELAHAAGVSTEFWDWQGRHTEVTPRAVVQVLAALGVDASTSGAVEASLRQIRDRAWTRVLPEVTVVRAGSGARIPVHVDHGTDVSTWVELEDGERRDLPQLDHWVDPRLIKGRLIGEASFALPDDLPLGWHRLHARYADGRETRPLVVTPAALPLPEAVRDSRVWGLMTQLYTARSALSWGIGDLADLADLADWGAREHGAGFVLVNPLHAAEPVPPMEPSPYLPTSRRFRNPIYLRVEDIREVAYLPSTDRAVIEWQAEEIRESNASADELDRDRVWEAKRVALEIVFAVPRSPARQAAFEEYQAREGQGLVDFATWCTLAERFGLPMRSWPRYALDPHSDGVAQLRDELADRVEFHMWLQWCLDGQLDAVQRTAEAAGMPIGVMHDLAVGVNPQGADAWALSDVLAHGVTVGAPPDAFNQQGQDWSQPPWRPDRLAEQGYAPYRDMLRTVLRHCGALRIDHVIGLFRLWWVPQGSSPAEGTYVRYDHEALIGILALEAYRAGALVVGEDLGTVEPWVRDYLDQRGLFGTSILWFEREEQGEPRRPDQWRSLCLATVTSHDLPPTAGYLEGVHVRLRERLGLLTRPADEEREADDHARGQVLGLLRELGLLGEDAGPEVTVEALHRFLTWTPAKLIGVALPDLVGDRRVLNQPGTSQEYPNWRLPLADGNGDPVLLEDVMSSAWAARVAGAVSGG